jgi:hypothetical protein
MILIIHAVSLDGQSRSNLREMFVSAEGDILFEDYAEALPKYLNLLQIYPENYNLHFRVGQCYMNTPGEKDKAIPFLETAVRNINPGYRKGRFNEKGAPYDALYFLANAWRIANDFDRALETYDLFLKDVDTEMYDTAVVRFQMQTCINARRMMRTPVCLVEENLGNTVNSRFSEFDPVISSDEKTILFTRELPFYDAIFWSTRTGEGWTEPVNLTPQLGIDQDYYTSSLTCDGHTLLLYRTDGYDGNIYSSELSGDRWSPVKKLNGNINTKYWESHATMSRDGRKIYFTSNRKESMGGLDIFVSERDSTGDWGPAVNLGPGINTVYNEETPFLANNDRTLFFSSRGHDNMGGYDIFRSDLDGNGRWTTPVNLGYPVNTTDDDLFFSPVGKGDRGYYSRFAGDGYGRMDIFCCDICSESNPDLPLTYISDTVHIEPVVPDEKDFHAFVRLVSDTLLHVSGPGPVNIDLVAEERSVLDIRLISHDSVADAGKYCLTDSTFTYTFNPGKGETRVTLTLTDRFGNDTTAFVTVDRSDARVRTVRPIYREIPVRTAVENPDKNLTQETVKADTIAESGVVGSDKTQLPGETDNSKGCRPWWLLVVAAVLIIFLLWQRRRKNEN